MTHRIACGAAALVLGVSAVSQVGAQVVAQAQMDLKVPSRIEREDVIAYLKSLRPQ